MRIISGKFGGRRIVVPKNLPIRPTTNLAKESIFNIITNKSDLKNLKIADTFSGSGLIGLEFISRGSDVIFVEKNIKCFKHIVKTLKLLGLNNKVFKSDVFKYLQTSKQKFDYIFADPPYKFSYEQYLQLIKLIVNNNLRSNGLLIIEHFKKNDFSDISEFEERRDYGDCSFSFFK